MYVSGLTVSVSGLTECLCHAGMTVCLVSLPLFLKCVKIDIVYVSGLTKCLCEADGVPVWG